MALARRPLSDRRGWACQARSFRRRPLNARERWGFTLVELVIAIVVLAIIAAVAVPSFLAQRRNGHDASTVSEVRTLAALQTAEVVSEGSGLTWKTGDSLEVLGGQYEPSDDVEVRAAADGDDWCVAAWNKRGNYNTDDTAVWASSDASGVQQGAEPQPTSACARLVGVDVPGWGNTNCKADRENLAGNALMIEGNGTIYVGPGFKAVSGKRYESINDAQDGPTLPDGTKITSYIRAVIGDTSTGDTTLGLSKASPERLALKGEKVAISAWVRLPYEFSDRTASANLYTIDATMGPKPDGASGDWNQKTAASTGSKTVPGGGEWTYVEGVATLGWDLYDVRLRLALPRISGMTVDVTALQIERADAVGEFCSKY